MKQSVFSGVATALVTPMTKDGFVNYRMLEKLIDFQIENQVDAIVLCGTTGEASTLTEAEHHDILVHAVAYAKGKIKIIAGIGSNDTKKAKRLTLTAKECNVDALLCVTPYYNKTTQIGLIRHYNDIANLTDLPLIVYNVPSRTGMNILPETYKELSKHQNIVAIKEAHTDLSQMQKTLYLCGDEIQLYSGNDELTLPVLSIGGKGVISVISNAFPKQLNDVCKLFFEGKITQSRQIMSSLIPLIDTAFCEVNPIPIKQMLTQLGFDVGGCRMPLSEPSNSTIEKISSIIK
jgi:4-hydroxy-tetrahydrodipicolinate synthase